MELTELFCLNLWVKMFDQLYLHADMLLI